MADTWTDYRGRVWPVVQSSRRLKFKYPAHAALRAHVFHVGEYRCAHCPAVAKEVPIDYSGRWALQTDTMVCARWSDVLVLDHILCLKAGGRNVVSNFQALCETCNKRKQKEDIAAAAQYRAEVPCG